MFPDISWSVIEWEGFDFDTWEYVALIFYSYLLTIILNDPNFFGAFIQSCNEFNNIKLEGKENRDLAISEGFTGYNCRDLIYNTTSHLLQVSNTTLIFY